MLAKVFKSHVESGFIPLAIPEIGEGKFNPPGINTFVLPNYDDFEFDEDIFESAPLVPPTSGDILQDARDEAAVIIARAEESRAIIEQVATEKAAQEARALVETEVAERTAEMRGQLAETMSRLSLLSAEITIQAEDDLVELAIQIAKKIVGREVTIDRDVAVTLVKVSLAKLHNRSIAQVHVNPEDLEYIEAHRDKLDFGGSLELVADRSISVGGCLIQTETGDIDARIESQFAEIAHGMLG